MHVARILRDTGHHNLAPAGSAFAGARQLLAVPEGAKPFHRDGWVFQVVAWIAAHREFDGDLIAPPHMQHAAKGCDGLIVQIEPESQEVLRAMICEEKATTSPRDVVRNEVWPEIASYQSGIRDNELTQAVSTLIAGNSNIDAEFAVERLIWSRARAYRVSVTIDDATLPAGGLPVLFKGYENVVEGDRSKRRAEVLELEGTREHLEKLANLALAALDCLEHDDV